MTDLPVVPAEAPSRETVLASFAAFYDIAILYANVHYSTRGQVGDALADEKAKFEAHLSSLLDASDRVRELEDATESLRLMRKSFLDSVARGSLERIAELESKLHAVQLDYAAQKLLADGLKAALSTERAARERDSDALRYLASLANRVTGELTNGEESPRFEDLAGLANTIVGHPEVRITTDEELLELWLNAMSAIEAPSPSQDSAT